MKETVTTSLKTAVVRLLIGAALMGAAYYYSAYDDLAARIWDIWGSYSMMIAIYPILTGMLGWEPFYALLHVRSCTDAGRNQCGTLPYQVEAMLGLSPKHTEAEDERSLAAYRAAPVQHPRHKVRHT